MSDIEVFTEDQLEITKPANVPTSRKTGKVLTTKQRAFLSYLGQEAEGDIRKAMELAGYSAETRPDEVVGSLAEEIIEISNKLLSTSSVKAVSRLLGVLDNPNKPGTKEIISAAKEVLDRVGIFKDKMGANQTVIKTDNVFILPPKVPIDKPTQD